MIIISNKPVDAGSLINEYQENSVERTIINILANSESEYRYDSVNQLHFELMLRANIIQSAKDLYKSRLDFEVFRDARCNPEYWELTSNGGFSLKDGARPSDAIRDIFDNGSIYGTECATAMVIVYYKALLNIFGDERFNKLFPQIYLMNWHDLDKNLKEIGLSQKAEDFLPGDRRYFMNPDVNPLEPEWQGENTIDLGNELYYGHGIGIHSADTIITELNKNRKEDADESAYLLNNASRPNFKKLANIFYSIE